MHDRPVSVEFELTPEEWVDASIEHEVHVYPEADHGFHCDQRGTYHEASAHDAWGRTLELFDETLRA